MNIREFLVWFLYRVSIAMLFVFIIIWSFAYYQNDLNPAEVPLYSLSNGSKEVRFQGMSHIGSKSFYEGVKKDIEIWKNDGFILFYEWVKPWTEENLEAFNEAIWIDFNPNLYENFSKLYWVQHQKNPEFLWITNDKDYNIDLDINTIMSIYRNKTWKNENNLKNTKRWEMQVADVWKDIIDQLSGLSERELSLMRYINKSVLNFIVKNEDFRDMMLEKFGNQDLFSVILDERNEYLVQNILASEASNIFVIYWLMHFEWVLEILQEKDPNWDIISIGYKRLID